MKYGKLAERLQEKPLRDSRKFAFSSAAFATKQLSKPARRTDPVHAQLRSRPFPPFHPFSTPFWLARAAVPERRQRRAMTQQRGDTE